MIASTLRAARQRQAMEMVLGKVPEDSCWKRFKNVWAPGRVIRGDEDVLIHAVPVSGASVPQAAGRSPAKSSLAQSSFPQYLIVIGVVAAVTVAAFVFTPLVGAHATALVFLLAVVLLAVVVERGPALADATLSALSWDYFFLPPVFAFRITHFEDAMLFGMYFVVALILGQLTARIRAQEEAQRRREERATSLYLLTRELSQAVNLDQLLQIVVHHMKSLFDCEIAFLNLESVGGLKVHSASTFEPSTGDQKTLGGILEDRQDTGELNRQHQAGNVLFVQLGSARRPVGILGLALRGPLPMHQQNLLEAFSQQIASALERHRLNEVADRAKLLAESERLSKTLLDSVSHEIRTPIAAIKSAAGNLAELAEFAGPNSLPREMIGEIEQAIERLNRLVGNVLEASRLESGNVRPRLNECDVAELLHVVVAETERELGSHRLTVHVASDLPLVRMDFVLMQQVLTNLLFNSVAHTPPGTAIELSAKVEENRLEMVVADHGAGIPAESLGKVFNKFYRAPNAPTGGTGLGLSLVKGFVEAHGGSVKAENRQGFGAVFTVCLPLQPAKTSV